MVSMVPIGTVRSPYTKTSQIPKGMGAVHWAEGILELLPAYEAGLTDIEGFSHLYVLWVFSHSTGYDLLGTPPTDTRPHGVFATRSPRRPNPIGMTVVKLLRREGCNLHVSGVDMLNDTPMLDIKPYLSSVPIEELHRGWLAEAEERSRAREQDTLGVSHKPKGYTSVSSYLIVDGASQTIDFLTRVFDAVELRRILNPSGRIMHAEVRIDDTVVMLADGPAGWLPIGSHVHIYVPDVDATYRRALEAGAMPVQEPVKKDDEDKRGGIKDSGGTTWWIATKVE